MTPSELRELERYLTPAEKAELDALLAADVAARPWVPLMGPQTMAYESLADITGYGGAAGGGKTDLIAGLALTKHKRVLVVRREKAQTEGVIQRLTEILNTTDGFNGQKSVWRIGEKLIEFAGLDNPGDEKRWQGRPHDLKAFDEVTEQREAQVRFVMGWRRTDDTRIRARVLMTFNPPTTSDGRWVIAFFAPWLEPAFPGKRALPGELRWAAMLPDGAGKSRDVWVEDGRPFVLVGGEPCYEYDPADYTPEQIIQPLSRTFIPARLTDNPYYMATGYMSTLQSLPEPLRSQMLNGDFMAGVEDDQWQVVPTKWVEAAQARWKPRSPKGEMMQQGVDVARGGKDSTIIANRHKDAAAGHDLWFDHLKAIKGADTDDGDKCAAQVLLARRDDAPINIDIIGVGSSPYDSLKRAGTQVWGVNVAEAARSSDRTGLLAFFNLRSELWWRMREALDPTVDSGIALPPDPELLAELCAPRWSLSGKTVKVESREEIVKRVGRSPDKATAVILALIDQPKLRVLRAAFGQDDVMAYDPMANMR